MVMLKMTNMGNVSNRTRLDPRWPTAREPFRAHLERLHPWEGTRCLSRVSHQKSAPRFGAEGSCLPSAIQSPVLWNRPDTGRKRYVTLWSTLNTLNTCAERESAMEIIRSWPWTKFWFPWYPLQSACRPESFGIAMTGLAFAHPLAYIQSRLDFVQDHKDTIMYLLGKKLLLSEAPLWIIKVGLSLETRPFITRSDNDSQIFLIRRIPRLAIESIHTSHWLRSESLFRVLL